MRIRPILFILIPLILFLFLFMLAAQGSAHHPSIFQKAECGHWEVRAEYFGGSQKKRLEWDVVLTVDGVVTNFQDSWEGKSDGFIIFQSMGTVGSQVSATGYVKMFDKQGNNWVVEKTENFDLNFNGNCVTPTVTLTSTPTITTTETPTPTLSSTPTPTASVTMTPGPTSTPQPGPTQTPGPGPTATPRPPEPQATPKGLEPGVQYGNK